MRGLRATLLRRIVPIVLGGLLLSAGWYTGVSLYGARFAAEGWLERGSSALPYVVEHVRGETAARLQALRMGGALVTGETLYELDASSKVTGTIPAAGKALPKGVDLSKLPAVGGRLYRADGRLVGVARLKQADGGSLVLVRDVGNTLADNLATAASAEVLVFVDGKTVGSSFRDAGGKRVTVTAAVELQGVLRQAKPSLDMGTGEYEVGKYGGFLGTDTERGSDAMDAYHALYPIMEGSEQLASLAPVVPTSVLLLGSQHAIAGTFVLMVGMAALMLLVIRRVADKYLAPLTAATNRLQKLSTEMARELPDGQESVRPPKLRTPNELVHLQDTVGRLEWVAAEKSRLEQELIHSKEALEAQTSDLIAAREEALDSARIKAEFLANMSHEIRTPMNGVIGLAAVLLKTDLSEQQGNYVRSIQRSGQDLVTLINDILDFSKIEAGKMSLSPVETDVRECVDDVLQLLAERALSNGTNLACIAAHEIPLRVLGDPVRLRQILTNLIGNAVKFTENGEVMVRVEYKGRRGDWHTLRFTVRDTGIGIPGHLQSKLFDAFTQADGSVARKFAGTGLGLSICKQLVGLMDGDIGVESKEGEGSTFWFTVRLQDVNRTTAGLPPVRLLSSRKLLVLCKEPSTRAVLSEHLKLAGASTTAVGTEAEAVKALSEATTRSEPFQLVVADSEGNRDEAASTVKALRDAVPGYRCPVMSVAAIGVLDDDDKKTIAADSYETKPIRGPHFIATVAQLLDREPVIWKPDTQSGPTAANTNEGMTILLVDDNPVNRQVASAMLELLGYSPKVAESGREAIRAVEDSRFDLVFMDCQMPDMDGFEATRSIRAKEGPDQRIPIIAMTAQAMRGDREACLAAGMDDYLTKPVDMERLKEVLEKWGPQNDNGAQVIESPPADAPPVDRSALLRITRSHGRDGNELLRRVEASFLSRARDDVPALMTAAKHHDPETMAAVAHGLKSSSQYIGATSFAELCRSVEILGRKGELPDGELLHKLEVEWERIREFLARGSSPEEVTGS